MLSALERILILNMHPSHYTLWQSPLINCSFSATYGHTELKKHLKVTLYFIICLMHNLNSVCDGLIGAVTL